MLYSIAVIILVIWLIGLIFHILGAFINILLVLAAIVIIYRLITGRKNAK